MGFEIAGFKVRDRIHKGRNLSVYGAIRGTDGLPLVVKVANRNAPDPVAAERLHNEFRILQRLDDPRIARVHTLEPYGGGVALFVEHQQGQTLGKRICAQQLSLEELLRMAVQMTEALVCVHESQVIHRDINPSNFMVAPESGDVTLIDFDLASLIPREPVEVRGPGALEGTLEYMSPEQTGRMNRTVDYRTDLYSLGATFYAMLTGAPPFATGDRLSLVHQHIARPPEPPSSHRPELPGVVDDIVLRLLAKTPERRYQSAVGLLADLRRCRDELRSDVVIGRFAIAAFDVSNRFQIPERLYGREAEVRALVDAFSRAVDDEAPLLMLVCGEPGVGKSSLVNEVHKPIVENKGYFATGKFDQFKRDVPFASLIEALRDLVRQVLTEPDDRVRQHRERLRSALGTSGQLLVDAIPELKLLTGPQEPLADLPPLESQNRFRGVFRGFLEAFARPEHPLCLLLDDVQWVDSATLEWIESTISDPGLGPLMLICAYRDNEVGGSHPLALSLDRLREWGAPIEEVALAPLSEEIVGRIVADTLVRVEPEVRDLTELLCEKTNGNPFFLNQLLGALYREGAIRFSSPDGIWTYDLEAIRAADITENVVEYMTSRLHLLSESAQSILRLAACVGSSFDAELLAVASEQGPDELRESLQEPLEQGLIVRIARRSGEQSMRYRFQHDRVQQAAYSLMDDAEAGQARLRIGRRILADCEQPETDDRLFDIVGHLNFAGGLIEDFDGRVELAGLNLAAAVRARRSTAYEPALRFVRAGMEVLPDGAPVRLRFDFALERAECEHLGGDDEAAEAFFAQAFEAARDDFERSDVYERKIHFYTNRAKFQRAYETGQEAARMLGIWLPDRFIPPLLIWDHLKILRRIHGRGPMELLDLPELEDERMRLALHFMAAVGKAAYQIRPELCVSICARIVELSLRHGYTEDSVIGFLAYGVIFRGAVRGDHRAGYEFGRLVLALVDRFDNRRQRAEVTFVFGYFANSWIRGLADSEEVFRRAYQAGIDMGDFFHASCACSAIVQNMLLRGAELESVSAEAERFAEFLERVQTDENIGAVRAVQQTIRNLRGETLDPRSLSDDTFDEEAFLATLDAYGSPHLALFYFVDKMLTLFLWGRYEEALDVSRAAKPFLKDSPGMQHAAEHVFLTALVRARLHDSASPRGRLGHVRALSRAARAHRKWAKDSPETFLHKQQLLEAELKRIAGQHEQAVELYDQAIANAEQHGRRHVKAMAHELAGRFHLEHGARRTARYHLSDAAQGYDGWGATALAADLARRHEALLGGVVFEREVSSGEHGTTTDHGGRSLDLKTVMKSSQAISGEVQLGELLTRLMTIVRENAGAERGVLLLARDGELLVQAEVSSEGAIEVLRHTPLDRYEGLARSIVNFVTRSGEALVLADASAEPRFGEDPHVARTQPRSVLCAPLRYMGDLSGVIYLENNLTADAFTEERIELLALLSGQIGISIANAELYEELKERVRLRTAQLETRNRFIRQTFGRYLSDEIVDELLDFPEGTSLVGEKRQVTVLIADLRGFTPIAEDLHPEEVVSLINSFLLVMTEVIAAHRGTIIDFIGDEIMAVFGAPFTFPDDAARAVACAIEMQRAMARVNELNGAAGYPPIGMGIGLDTGEVVVGSIGSERRAKYTVLGRHVNLASRIETCSIQGDVLVSASTRDAAGPVLRVSRDARVQLKGFHEPVTIFYVAGLDHPHNVELPERESRLAVLSDPVRIHYVDVDGKHVGDDDVEGWLIGLSETEAEIRGALVPDALRNLRLTWRGVEDDTLHAYAKVLAHDDLTGDAFRVTFTSLPARTRTEILSVLKTAKGSWAPNL